MGEHRGSLPSAALGAALLLGCASSEPVAVSPIIEVPRLRAPVTASGGARPPAREQATPAASSRGPVDCRIPNELGPSIVSDAAYAARYGAQALAFAALPTSKELPLEECGIQAALQRLIRLECGAGFRPFGDDLERAHASRRGSLDGGGRCGRSIDVYAVACPEKTYDVFVDAYFCSEAASVDY